MIPIDEVIVFDVVTHHPTTAAASDGDSAPTFDVFEEDTDTPILSAVTMTKRTSKTGNYRGSITCSTANGFEAGKWYSVVVSATVSSVSAKCVAKHFRVAPVELVAGVPKVDVADWLGTAPSTPTVAGVPNVNTKTWNDLATVALPLIPATPGRSLVVDAAGLADANAVKVGPSGSGSAQTAGDLMADTNDIQTRLPAALVGGRMDASVGAMAAGVLTATAIAADAITDAKVASDVTIASVSGAVGSVTGLTASDVGAIKAKTDTLPSDPADASDIAASFTSVASTLTTIAGYLDTEIAAIKAKTDALPSDPADASDIAASFSSVAATLSTIAAYVDTEIAAIKAKTDLIPAAPAAVGDIPTAVQNRAEMDSNSTRLAAIAALWTTALTESYSVDGAAPTPAQALFVIMQRLTEFAISGTTITAKKLDGTTTAFTLTIDDAVSPTASTRAT